MNLPKQIWEGEDRLFQCISAQNWLKNKRHREMIAISTPKTVSIIGSFALYWRSLAQKLAIIGQRLDSLAEFWLWYPVC
jgi:hypothetical protein